MNKLKDWRLLFLVGVLFSYSLLLMTMVNDFYELPSDGFSKEVFLRSYEKPNTYEAYDDRSFTSGKLENGFYLLVNDGHQLVYETYSKEGVLLTTSIVKDSIEAIIDMSSEVKGSQLEYLLLADDALYRGALSIQDGLLTQDGVVDRGIDKAVLHGNSVVYHKANQYYYFDGTSKELFKDSTIKVFDFVVADNQLYMTTISRNAGPFYTDLFQVDLSEGTWAKDQLKSYITASATKEADHQMVVEGNQVRSMSIFRDSRTSNTYYKELVYDIETPKSFEFNKFEMLDFPNFRYKINSDQSISMMLEQFTFVGKTELASADSTYRNLVEMKIENDQRSITKLTKMKKSHPTYDFFEISGEDYLVFNTVDRESQSSEGFIYFASSLPSVVESSNNLTTDDFRELVFGALTVIPAALAVGFIPSMGFLFPVIIVIMPLSMIKITWTEHHPEKLLRAAVLVYGLSILAGFYDSATKIINEMQVMSGSIPWHLHSITSMYTMLLGTFIVSYIAYRWFSRKKPDSNFMVQFGIMFICQSMFYIMLFHAYPLLAN
jgi:hypothetical protein